MERAKRRQPGQHPGQHPGQRLPRQWRTLPFSGALREEIMREFGCSRMLAEMLLRRSVDSLEKVERFLSPRLTHLHDPALLPGIDVAIARLAAAVRAKEKVVVFGDYDVDGIASTALLLRFFRFLGHPAAHYLPDRLREGYGMNVAAVRRLAAEGAQLVVAVDNGSTANEAIEAARALGVDVVVIDHHLPAETLPPANALVNPWLPGSAYPFPELAGVGVTFKVIWALAQHFSRSRKVSPEFREFLLESLALVALGTVADVVPLRDENRVLVGYGLRALAATRQPGLRELLRLAVRDREGGRPLVAEDVAFGLGPCLNAAGRLGRADLGLALLTCEDDTEAQDISRRLVAENVRRRRIEREILADVRETLAREHQPADDRVIVLAREGWHPGVIGIVASRVVEEFFRPTFLICLDGDRGTGSCRSIPQVAICDLLERARHCLVGFGGHAMAAGLRIVPDRVDELRRLLNAAVDLPPEAMVPEIEIDGEYDLDVWTPGTLRELDRLAPFGAGNRAPRFAVRGARVVGTPRLLGRDSSHLAFFVKGRDTAVRAIGFGMGELYAELEAGDRSVSFVYTPLINSWAGRESVELRVHDLQC